MKLHTLTTTATSPAERGREIGTRYALHVRDASARYLAHFELLGITETTVRETADASHDALRAWAPGIAEESDAMADAAGLEAWQVAAVGARTEILAKAPTLGECTTAVYVPPAGGAPETIQTWDWHDTLAPDGLLLAFATKGGRGVKLFTEFGTAAKIGVNDGGLGLHFNILSHRSDGVDAGVPVHAIARRVLEEATTVAEARDLAASAAVSASTVLTVATVHDGAASIEMAPDGIGVVRPAEDGWLIHTNHFLDPVLAAGDTITADAVSTERFEHTREARAAMVALTPAQRAGAFCGTDGAGAIVCMHPDAAKAVHEQWGTLLTISLDVAGFGLDYRAGTPDEAARDGLERF
ncbi:C45 family autoproteolytic acyltransferase/hydolase [Microbacterium sp. ASV49]|uniref:C45 family autoproteolytic acyltransferase/hydrolase n=1 Tax=Microbacterium candidum TaxID=3041922 RepID=A0ABT7MVS9_9MICO|nr:C45 family peptidase [Microbacterium sp. ASV49]MDL9978559.1 C45 family autoproteolytic acyltransferase/hydrolase [Microbacterium sp. ASV49]